MNDRTGVRYISTADGGIFAVNTKSQSHNQQVGLLPKIIGQLARA